MTEPVQLHRGDVDGVSAYWAPQAPGPQLNATLWFRAGMADLPLIRHGWLHLLEHMALHGQDSTRFAVNGSVSLLTLRFDVAADPADAVAFLNRLAAWLRDPDLSALEHERRVLQAEARQRPSTPTARHLLWRYGACGPGIVAYDEYGLWNARPDDLRGLAGDVFVAGNAVLSLSGPPPAGLRLELPSGSWRPIPGRVFDHGVRRG